MREINVKEIFPKGSNKTYGLMQLMKAKEPLTLQKDDDKVFSWPHVFIREIILMAIITGFLLIAAVFIDAPLEEMANPNQPPNPAKAPWYFLGLQEMVSYSALIGGVVIPGVIVGVLILIPYVDRKKVGIGVWFAKERSTANGLFLTFLIIMLILIVMGTYFRGPNWSFVLPWEMTGAH